jgi:hypothetical protein
MLRCCNLCSVKLVRLWMSIELVYMQKCSFRVDYKIDAIDREFGTVIVERDGAQVDLSAEVVKA